MLPRPARLNAPAPLPACMRHPCPPKKPWSRPCMRLVRACTGPASACTHCHCPPECTPPLLVVFAAAARRVGLWARQRRIERVSEPRPRRTERRERRLDGRLLTSVVLGGRRAHGGGPLSQTHVLTHCTVALLFWHCRLDVFKTLQFAHSAHSSTSNASASAAALSETATAFAP